MKRNGEQLMLIQYLIRVAILSNIKETYEK